MRRSDNSKFTENQKTGAGMGQKTRKSEKSGKPEPAMSNGPPKVQKRDDVQALRVKSCFFESVIGNSKLTENQKIGDGMGPKT